MNDRSGVAPFKSDVRIVPSKLPLAAFQEDVERSRKVFLKELQNLPEPLNAVATRQYLHRIEAGHGQAVLGEYAPWMIADLTGIDDREAVGELVVPWLCIYSYIVFLDVVIDQQEVEDKRLLLIAAGLLLERALTRLHNLSPHAKDLMQATDRYFLETAIAAVDELNRHRAKVQCFTKEEVATLGRKVAALKLCTVYVLSTRGVKEIGASDLRAIDALGSAVQILDDITDWEEDWRSGNYTYPLTLTFERLFSYGVSRAADPQKMTTDEVFAGMIWTKGLHEALEQSLEFFKTAIHTDKPRAQSATTAYIQEIIKNGFWLADKLSEARAVIDTELQLIETRDWLNQLVTRERVQRELGELKRLLLIVTQPS
jgi:hypothetical protein